MTRKQTRQIQQDLLKAYSKAVDLEFALLHKERTAEAAEAKARANKLRGCIDALRATLWGSWRGQAASLTDELRANNARLQASIRKLEQTVGTAQDVTKALGYVDKAIATAVRILVLPQNLIP